MERAASKMTETSKESLQQKQQISISVSLQIHLAQRFEINIKQ